jgi:phosphodiesterase/alkaline phosphatase D-like protein
MDENRMKKRRKCCTTKLVNHLARVSTYLHQLRANDVKTGDVRRRILPASKRYDVRVRHAIASCRNWQNSICHGDITVDGRARHKGIRLSRLTVT